MDLSAEDLNVTCNEEIDLGGTQIQDLSFIKQRNTVPTTLKLYDNKLINLQGVALLPNITNLNVSTNYLTDCDFARSLPRLNYANLSCNFIESLEGFRGHTQIQIINISFNRLHAPQQFGPLKSCRNLRQLINYDGLHNPPTIYKQNKITLHSSYPQCLLPYLPKQLQYIDSDQNIYQLTQSDRQILSNDHYIPENVYQQFEQSAQMKKLLRQSVASAAQVPAFTEMAKTMTEREREKMVIQQASTIQKLISESITLIQKAKDKDDETRFTVIDDIQAKLQRCNTAIAQLQSIELFGQFRRGKNYIE